MTDQAMMKYADRYWTSRDGLQLHYRDYPGPDDRLPIICLHALTRNAREFATLAERLSGEWRVLCPEMRGRGESEYARDSSTYTPMQYVDDLTVLLEHEGIERFIAIGTSLGGLMTMILAASEPQRIAGAVFNDIGPRLDPAGLARIKTYVGQGRSFPTWLHAARGLEELQGAAYPEYEISEWLEMAKQLMTVSGNGRIVLDYDMKIAEPLAEMDVYAQPDLWPGIDALAGKPILIVRGGISDLFSSDTLEAMQERLPGAETVTVPGIGHAPTLGEPEAAAAIDRFLGRLA